MSNEEKQDTGVAGTLGEVENVCDSTDIRSSILSLTPLRPPSTASSMLPGSKPSLSSEEESVDSNEETRVNYFLQCFSTTPTMIGDEENAAGHREEDDISNYEVDHGYDGDHDEETVTEGEYETVLTGASDESVAVVAPSLLNDDDILRYLRSTLYGTAANQVSFDTNDGTTDQSSDGSTDETMDRSVGAPDNRTTPKQIQKQQEQQQREERLHDPMVALFFKFFEFAQAQRLKKPYSAPYFVMSLFTHLSNVRSDLEWAQDAAYRRQTGKPYVAWADYFAKDRPQPWFTYAMLIAITCTMIWAFYENDWTAESWKTNPTFGPSHDVLLKMGAVQGKAMIEEGKWWLLVTPVFLHAGLIHFLLNAALFFVLCRTIERNHGWLHTALLFLLSGIVGNMISTVLQPNLILVGSSGGIYGLYGACLGDIVLNSRFFFLVLEERAQKEILQAKREKLGRKLRRQMKRHRRNGTRRSLEEGGRAASATDLIIQACDPVAVQSRRRWVRFWCYVSLVIDLLFNAFLGLFPFVDNFAHLGGMLFGFFVSLSSLRLLSASSFDYHKRQEKTTFGKWCHALRTFTLRCGGGLSAMCLVLLAAVFLQRSDGTHSPCPNCRYASCMPLPKPWKPNDPSNWWSCDGCANIEGYVYWGVLGQESILVTADVYCPLGETVQVDIANRGYTEFEHAIQALPDLCREYCNEF